MDDHQLMASARGRPLFEIVPPTLSPRLNGLLRGLYLTGALVFVLGVASEQYVVALAMLLMCLAPMAFRHQSRNRVIAHDDVLIIRNREDERILRREDVVEFFVATPSLGEALKADQAVAPAIYVRLRDGSRLPLRATIRKLPDGSLQESLDRLEEWLHRTSSS